MEQDESAVSDWFAVTIYSKIPIYSNTASCYCLTPEDKRSPGLTHLTGSVRYMHKATQPHRQRQLWAFTVFLHRYFCPCYRVPQGWFVTVHSKLPNSFSHNSVIGYLLVQLECLRGSPLSCSSLCQLPRTFTVSVGMLFEAMTTLWSRFRGKLVCIHHKFYYKLYLYLTKTSQG